MKTLNKIQFAKKWINDLLENKKIKKQSIISFNFKRLDKYFSKELLEVSDVILCDKIPVLPLEKLGLKRLKKEKDIDFIGMTYDDCFFIKENQKKNESLFFHELVHILQWKYLGIDNFLLLYAIELEKNGYRENFFEEMAYYLQEKFDNNEIFNAEKIVQKELKKFMKNLKIDLP